MKVFKETQQLEIFLGYKPEYGGHWQWLSILTGLDYLLLTLIWREWGYFQSYYDGQHHTLSLGFIAITWGGWPYPNKKSIGGKVVKILERYFSLNGKGQTRQDL